MTERIVAAVSLAIWIYLAVGHGRFWTTRVTVPRSSAPDPERWPSVTAIVPARNEAETLPRTLPALLSQRYPGRFRVIVVDDDSTDGTGDVAARAGATVIRSPGPRPGWAGKVAAMAAGVRAATGSSAPAGDARTGGARGAGGPSGAAGDTDGPPDWFWFTDADIEHEPGVLVDLVRAGLGDERDLVSQMALLRTASAWERWIVPVFVYFFAQLYPFRRVNGTGATAAAAGGCMLVRRTALERAGGLETIRSALIDDVALGRLLAPQGRVWLGLSRQVRSVRPYPRLRDLWDMIARSAYHQLRYSPLILAATVLGLVLVYLVPPAAVVVGLALPDVWLVVLGGAAWVIMAGSIVPLLRFYGVGWWRAPALPLVALMYTAMTVDSARRHWTGDGAWRGRSVRSNAARPG